MDQHNRDEILTKHSDNNYSDEGQGDRTSTPAEKGDELVRKMKHHMGRSKESGHHIWKGLSFWERVIAVGAILGLATIFMPWASEAGDRLWGWTIFWHSYLIIPISFLIVLVLIYFSQGGSRFTRALRIRWVIILSSMWTGIFVAMTLLVTFLSGFIFFASPSDLLSLVSIGGWVFIISMVTIMVASIKHQGALIKPEGNS